MAFTSTQNPDGTITCVIDTGEPYNFVAWLEANVTDSEDLNDFKEIYQSQVDQENLLISQNKVTSTVNGNTVTTIYENRAALDSVWIESIRSYPKQYEYRLVRSQYNHGESIDGVVLAPLE